jgi:hypothetical protein
MAWDYSQTLAAKWQQNEVERSRALAEIDAAHVNEDWQSLEFATDRLRSAENEAAWLSQKARNLQHQQQRAQAQQPSNKWGLSRAEEEVALAAIQDRADVRLSREQKLQSYAQQKQRYQQMRASGAYSDGQGTQREKF